MVNNNGIVYLVQPSEFIGTDIFKIGYSCVSNLKRCHSYGPNTKYICIMHTEKPRSVEKNLIKAFTDAFLLHKGREYFKGDENQMQQIFSSLVVNYITTETPSLLNDAELQDISNKKQQTRFNCRSCDYSTDRKDNYERHMNSQRHMKRNMNNKHQRQSKENNFHFTQEMFMYLMEQNNKMLDKMTEKMCQSK